MSNEIKAYICNGKAQCNLRKDGKKNEFCYINGMNSDCKHTLDKKYAKYTEHNNFRRDGPYILDGKETYYLIENEKFEINRPI